MQMQRERDSCMQFGYPVSPNPAPLKKRRLNEPDEFSLLNPTYAGVRNQPLATYNINGIIQQPPPSASSALFTLLSEDLLVCICEHFDIRELALLDRVGRCFRNMLNLPTGGDPAQLQGHAANYIWRNAALSHTAWPFPKRIDREHLERVVLKHLRDVTPRSPVVGSKVVTSTSPVSSSLGLTLPAPVTTASHQDASNVTMDLLERGQSTLNDLGDGHMLAESRSSQHSSSSFSHTAGFQNVDVLSAQVNSSAAGFQSMTTPAASTIPSGSSTSTNVNVKPLPAHAILRSAIQAPLNWKSILASVSSRTASRGTGTCVLDMGSCTVSVGLGGPDAGQHGTTEALPKSFPAIALNDLVGDQIGSASVRCINPVSSISMPILHANETGEFSYCSPIWKYALQRVPEEAYTGRAGKVAAAAAAATPAGVTLEQTQPAITGNLNDPNAMQLVSEAIQNTLQQQKQSQSSSSAAMMQLPLEAGTVLICDQLLGSKLELAKKRAKVARILFALQPANSKLKLAFCNESFLSLLNTGKTTGVVLHVGFSRSTCAIFVNGRIQNLSSLPTRMVGGHIHSRIMLQALFSRRQFQPAVADMFAVIPMLKEMCYVSEDTAEEQQKPREITHVEITITDKKLTLGHERFTSSDVFFLYGFPAMVVEALQSSPAWPVLQKPILPMQSSSAGGEQPPSTLYYMQSLMQPPGHMATPHSNVPAAAAQSSSSAPVATTSAGVGAADQDTRMSDGTPEEFSLNQHSVESMVDHLQSAYQQGLVHAQAQASSESTSSSTGPQSSQPGLHASLIDAHSPVAFPSNAVQQRAIEMDTRDARIMAAAKEAQAKSSAGANGAAGGTDQPSAMLVDEIHPLTPPSTTPAISSPYLSASSSSPRFSSSSYNNASYHSPSSAPMTAPGESEEDEPHQLIKTLLQSIVLSGRSTSLRGFAQRFERDLNAILKQNTPAKVHENHVECTWLGGSVLSSLSIFPALTITREEFVHDGINAILRHMEI